MLEILILETTFIIRNMVLAMINFTSNIQKSIGRTTMTPCIVNPLQQVVHTN